MPFPRRPHQCSGWFCPGVLSLLLLPHCVLSFVTPGGSFTQLISRNTPLAHYAKCHRGGLYGVGSTSMEFGCDISRRNLFAKVVSGGVFLALQGAGASQAMDLEQYDGPNPRAYVRRGMDRFRKGMVKESVADFDKAIELDASQAGYLWQRGLSLYYADRFEDASRQFKRDVALNPRDTEEAVWNFLSQAQRQIISIVGETRPYMKVVYEVYAGKRGVGDLAALTAQADELAAGPPQKGGVFSLARGDGREAALQTSFYGWMYLGLLAEAAGKAEEAKRCMLRAAQSEYGQTQDYMWYLANVHCAVRGWQ